MVLLGTMQYLFICNLARQTSFQLCGQTHPRGFAEKEAIKEKLFVISKDKSFDKTHFQICNSQCEMEAAVCM